MTLLSVSNTHIIEHDSYPIPASGYHRPHFWVFAVSLDDLEDGLERLRQHAHASHHSSPLKGITWDDPVMAESFWRGDETWPAARVYTRHPGLVPAVSDIAFHKCGLWAAEHDVPYIQRLTVDLAAHQDMMVFDTKGSPLSLATTVFDIETTQHAKEGRNAPIDMIGFASFPFKYSARADLDNEDYDVEVIDAPNDWDAVDIEQIAAWNGDEEIELLKSFVAHVKESDVLSGHNIHGFDTLKIHERITHHLNLGERSGTMSGKDINGFADFLKRYVWTDEVYSFGRPQQNATLVKANLDTLLAARKFYFFHDSFTLKSLAPLVGCNIPDRVIVQPSQMGLDDNRTWRYHLHDIKEQLALTMNMMPQSVPLAFTTGMPFEQLFGGLNTKMWDHIAMIRAAKRNRLMPALSSARGITRTILEQVGSKKTKAHIEEWARNQGAPTKDTPKWIKNLHRAAKYGPEMPEWVEYPWLIYGTPEVKQDEAGDAKGYEFPGGMTIHPDKLDSHLIPWWHVVDADVGAMYPTILRAHNVGADTIRAARKGEEPDAWVWLYDVEPTFREHYNVRRPDEREPYADRGYMIGVKKRKGPGLVGLGMQAILALTKKIRDESIEAMRPGSGVDPVKAKLLKETYKSLKPARNAGTHGIMSALNVACRQFNILAGSSITSEGQRILHAGFTDIKDRDLRLLYSDTDSFYVACGRAGASNAKVAEALGTSQTEGSWISKPDEVKDAVAALRERFREELNWPDFELDPEEHHCVVFIAHKNYLTMNAHGGKFHVAMKGNNFTGRDKPPMARTQLKAVMNRALKDCASWSNEAVARQELIAAIKRAAIKEIEGLDPSTFTMEDLILIQSVKPARYYKPGPNGALSAHAQRSVALNRLLQTHGQEPIRQERRFHFLVANRTLPGIERKRGAKPGSKPMAWMWPKELVAHTHWREQGLEIDYDWYRQAARRYIESAFGFGDLEAVEQASLAAWI